MTAMSIQDQDAPMTICFFPSPRLKTPSKPFQAVHIASPPLFSAREPPTLGQFWWYQPFRGKFHSMENNKWVDHASIATNAFNDCDPLLPSRSCLKLALNSRVNYDTCSLSRTDCKAGLIHIVNVFCCNVILFDHLMYRVKPQHNGINCCLFHPWHVNSPSIGRLQGRMLLNELINPLIFNRRVFNESDWHVVDFWDAFITDLLSHFSHLWFTRRIARFWHIENPLN